MRVLVIYTGGTIGMKETPHGYAPGANLEAWLSKLCAEAFVPCEVAFDSLELLIDSALATPLQWQRIVDEINDNYDNADAFLVLHGTDTLAYTAAALSFALSHAKKPIAITGSQIPALVQNSDAGINVLNAFSHVIEAWKNNQRGVCICFGGKRLQGSNATKVSSVDMRAFDGAAWNSVSTSTPAGASAAPRAFRICDIAVLTVAPGMSARRIEAMVDPLPEALVIRAYGMGNVPDAEGVLEACVKRLAALKIPVVVTSQCATGGVELGRYEASSPLLRAGAISAQGMTFDSCYAKVAYLLSQEVPYEQFAQAMLTSLAGECEALS